MGCPGIRVGFARRSRLKTEVLHVTRAVVYTVQADDVGGERLLKNHCRDAGGVDDDDGGGGGGGGGGRGLM